MKTKLLLITAVLLYFTSFSQVNVLHSIPNTSQLSYGGIEKLNNNNYIFSNGSYAYISDENGLITDTAILDKGVSLLKTFVVKDTNIYIGSAFYHSDSINRYVALTCYDYNLDTIWSKVYLNDTAHIIAYSIINTFDNGFIIIGSLDKGNNQYDGFLLKLDSIGNQQWYKEFGETTKNETFYKIVQTPDSGYIVMYKKETSIYNSKLSLLRIDNTGNLIWDWDLIDNYSNLYYSDIIKTNDDKYIVVSNDDNPNDSLDYYTAELIKFDIDKNIINDVFFPEDIVLSSNNKIHYSFFSAITQKDNGNYIVISYKQSIITYNTLGYVYPVLYELDNNFNIIKRREYRPIPTYYNWFYLKDISLNSDGSVAMIGDATVPGPQYYPPQQLWFINTDTNYCDGFGSCDTSFYAVLNYPDSISKTDTINITAEIISDWNIDYNLILSYYYKNNEMMFIANDTLFNVLPNQIQQIPLSYDILTDKNVYPTNTISDSIFIKYDIIPSDNVSHINTSSLLTDNHFLFYEPDSNIYVPELQDFGNISLYPNPTNSDIQLKIDNNKLLGSKIEIIDINSKVIKEQIINNLITKIDLSKEEKGIYFIKIINDKGIITKKIVLE